MSFTGQDWRRLAATFISGERPTFGTVLVGLLLKAYGAPALEWDPLTIRVQLKSDFGVDIARVPYAKMMALINVLTTDSVYRSVQAFDATVHAFAGRPADGMDGFPGVDDVAWACAEIAMADPEPPMQHGQKLPWSPAIQHYVGMALDHEGIAGEPKVLSWAQRRNVHMASDQTGDPDFYNAAMGTAQAKASEVDGVVDGRVAALVHDLQELGIKPASLT